MARYLHVNEVAEIVRRHPRTIYRWLDEGFLHAKKVRDGWLIPEDELQKIIKEKWDESKTSHDNV